MTIGDPAAAKNSYRFNPFSRRKNTLIFDGILNSLSSRNIQFSSRSPQSSRQHGNRELRDAAREEAQHVIGLLMDQEERLCSAYNETQTKSQNGVPSIIRIIAAKNYRACIEKRSFIARSLNSGRLACPTRERVEIRPKPCTAQKHVPILQKKLGTRPSRQSPRHCRTPTRQTLAQSALCPAWPGHIASR